MFFMSPAFELLFGFRCVAPDSYRDFSILFSMQQLGDSKAPVGAGA